MRPHWMKADSVMKRQASSSPDSMTGSMDSPRATIVKSYLGKEGMTGICSHSLSDTEDRATESPPAAALSGIRGRV